LSSEHSKVLPASLPVKESVAVLERRDEAGAAVIVVSGEVMSSPGAAPRSSTRPLL